MGVAPRRLWGWEPETVTRWCGVWWNPFTWRWVTRVESEFDREQVDYLLAYDAFKRDFGANGELLSEAVSDDANPNNYDGSYRYAARGPFTNWAEKAVLDAQDAYRKAAGESENLNGMFWVVDKLDR